MAIFAPVYRPTRGQQSYHTHQQNAERKRKRDHESSAQSENEAALDPSDSESSPRAASSISRHVNRTDPYYVAGTTRQDVLPSSPFPHAAVKARTRFRNAKINEDLATLAPPLCTSSSVDKDRSHSFKRQHANNLTTILHSCVLKDDWQRASRAWSLLLRTEIGGRGIDVRHNGRWGLAAELLMRFNTDPAQSRQTEDVGSNESPRLREDWRGVSDVSPFSDNGIRLAREYYERLILQYPHTPHSQHSINALVFYPALFNIWIYGTQSSNNGLPIHDNQASSAASDHSDPPSRPSSSHNDDGDVHQQQLEEALKIAQRMDEVMQGPPYDASIPLLRMRGILGLWLYDLCSARQSKASPDRDSSTSSVQGSKKSLEHHRAEPHRLKGLRALAKVRQAGEDLPLQWVELLEQEEL